VPDLNFQEGEFKHIPVMLEEVLGSLCPKEGETFLDCTLGGAGHSIEVAKRIGCSGTLIGVDQDSMARKAAIKRFKAMSKSTRPRVFVIDSNFAEIDSILSEVLISNEDLVCESIHQEGHGDTMPGIDIVLFDLGVSSAQLDLKERGFTYHEGAFLDMRMNQNSSSKSASDLLNTLERDELERILRVYGEERFSRQIASNIVKTREEKKITKSEELVEIVKDSIPAAKRRSGGHPAKRTFQALRIAVNDELSALERGLDAAIRWLRPGGRICVISYHSLEDRIVKDKFRSLEDRCVCDVDVPICTCGRKPILKSRPRGAITPTREEVEANPRARSAKLRCAIKI
jgi:16S rRNA (cytosine1402-N4)-methyltransferase